MSFAKGKVKSKPDARGKIVVRVFLLDENAGQPFYPKGGNLRQDFVVEGATVSDVAEVVNSALFADESSPPDDE